MGGLVKWSLKKRYGSQTEANNPGVSYTIPIVKLEHAHRLLNDAIWEMKQQQKLNEGN